jgi:hypothetical protein
MDLRELDGRTVALVMMGSVDGDPDEWGMVVAAARYDGSALVLDFGTGPFAAGTDMLVRLAPTPAEIRETLGGAEWFIPCPITPLPPGTDPAQVVAARVRPSA